MLCCCLVRVTKSTAPFLNGCSTCVVLPKNLLGKNLACRKPAINFPCVCAPTNMALYYFAVSEEDISLAMFNKCLANISRGLKMLSFNSTDIISHFKNQHHPNGVLKAACTSERSDHGGWWMQKPGQRRPGGLRWTTSPIPSLKIKAFVDSQSTWSHSLYFWATTIFQKCVCQQDMTWGPHYCITLIDGDKDICFTCNASPVSMHKSDSTAAAKELWKGFFILYVAMHLWSDSSVSCTFILYLLLNKNTMNQFSLQFL